MSHTPALTPRSTMQEVLQAFPGAQRALFRQYHIGGCASCGFQPSETLEAVCRRSNNLDPQQVLQFIETSHAQDEKILISPGDLADLLAGTADVKLLDIRSRPEFDAVRIDGSIFMSQETMKEIMGTWPREQLFVIVDHAGKSGLDAAAYFLGHGFSNVRALRGGIDAWAVEVDPKMRRYRLG